MNFLGEVSNLLVSVCLNLMRVDLVQFVNGPFSTQTTSQLSPVSPLPFSPNPLTSYSHFNILILSPLFIHLSCHFIGSLVVSKELLKINENGGSSQSCDAQDELSDHTSQHYLLRTLNSCEAPSLSISCSGPKNRDGLLQN